MYAGELLSYLAVVLSNPTLWNGLLLIVIVLVFILRIGWEEHILGGYADYCQRVRWRLLPQIW
jgi:protein-S-isoprenylcysteine O-methyltransferase Ste14